MKILNKIKTMQRNNNGEIAVEFLVGFLIISIVILFAIDFFNLTLKYQNVSYSAKSIAKVIECDGAVTDRAYEQMEDLNDNFNMDMKFDVLDVKYFDSREKKIQFRDDFTVKVYYNAKIKLLSPLFRAPVVLDVPMKSDVTGMSEVYWK